MQDARRLDGSVVHRHAGLDIVVADFGKFNADVFDKRVGDSGIQAFDGGVGEPYGHAMSFFAKI